MNAPGRQHVRALTSAESDLLEQCEDVINHHLEAWIEVANALETIRANKLFRKAYATFEEYCQGRWSFSASRARQLMAGAESVTTVTLAGLPAPSSERLARELARLSEDERVEVWRLALELTGGNPTAADVRAAAEETAGLAGPAPDAEQASSASGTAAAGEPAAPAAAPEDHPGSSSPGVPEESTGTTPERSSDAAGAATPSAPAAPPDTTASGVPGGAALPSAPAGGPATSPAGPPCEKCGTDIADDGYRRCADCDPDGMHTASDDGGCRLCALLGTVPDEYLPIQVGEGVHGLQLECRCGAVVSYLKAGMPLGIALVEARLHHGTCQ